MDVSFIYSYVDRGKAVKKRGGEMGESGKCRLYFEKRESNHGVKLEAQASHRFSTALLFFAIQEPVNSQTPSVPGGLNSSHCYKLI